MRQPRLEACVATSCWTRMELSASCSQPRCEEREMGMEKKQTDNQVLLLLRR